MILNKRILRELKSNFLRYFSLLSLVILCVFIVTGLVGSAESIMHTVKENSKKNNLEDGQFSVLTPLTNIQLKEIEDKGATVEPMFYLDYKLKNGSVLRIFENRKNINKIDIDNGRIPKNNNEILLEKLYSNSNNLSIGDNIEISGLSFSISGIGSTPDYDAPFENITDVSSNSDHFGTAFVNSNAYKIIKSTNQSIRSEEYLYSYKLEKGLSHKKLKNILLDYNVEKENIEDSYLVENIDRLESDKNEITDSINSIKDGSYNLEKSLNELNNYGENLVLGLKSVNPKISKTFEKYVSNVNLAAVGSEKLYNGISEFSNESEKVINKTFDISIPNLKSFIKAENNSRIEASYNDVQINKSAGLLAGIIVLGLLAYVLSVFIIQSIDSDSEVIGTLYALGVSRKTIQYHYLLLPIIIGLIGAFVGTFIGFSPWIMNILMKDTINYFSFPTPITFYPTYLIIYGLLLPPLIAGFINYIIIHKKLKQAPLNLLKKLPVKSKNSSLKFNGFSFMNMFRFRQILREKRGSFAVFGGMFISFLLLLLGLNCYTLINTMKVQNKKDIPFEYMTSIKYTTDEIPKNTEAFYMKNLSHEKFGYNMDISILGMEDNNSYFKFKTPSDKNSIVISSSVASKFNWKKGDDIILLDDVSDKRYVFTVDRIVPYSVGLYAFLNIDNMRETFDIENGDYNIILSNEKPNIENGRIYSITSKNDLLKTGDTLMNLMTPLVVMLIVVSSMVFLLVLYLMMKMMIDRSTIGISLFKIFGFNNNEIRKLYLDGNFLTVILSTVIGIPIAKIIMDKVYPLLIANMSVGADFKFPIWIYIVIFIAIILSYTIINFILQKNFKKITTSEILSRRE